MLRVNPLIEKSLVRRREFMYFFCQSDRGVVWKHALNKHSYQSSRTYEQLRASNNSGVIVTFIDRVDEVLSS